MKTVGIFSGSFNPIHIGHLALANWICEYEPLDELWFLVTPHNPLKAENTLMNDRFRLSLVEVSIKNYGKFRTSDFEFSLPRPSYTIHTLRALRKAYPEVLFVLIVGSDSWSNLSRWKESEALIREFPIWVYPRQGYEVAIPPDLPAVRCLNAPIIEISSTFIRQAIREEKDVRFFLSEAVWEYIPEIRKSLERNEKKYSFG